MMNKKKWYMLGLGIMAFRVLMMIVGVLFNVYGYEILEEQVLMTYVTALGYVNLLAFGLLLIALLMIVINEVRDGQVKSSAKSMAISNLSINIIVAITLLGSRVYIAAIVADEANRITTSVSVMDNISILVFGQSILSMVVFFISLILLIKGYKKCKS